MCEPISALALLKGSSDPVSDLDRVTGHKSGEIEHRSSGEVEQEVRVNPELKNPKKSETQHNCGTQRDRNSDKLFRRLFHVHGHDDAEIVIDRNCTV